MNDLSTAYLGDMYLVHGTWQNVTIMTRTAKQMEQIAENNKMLEAWINRPVVREPKPRIEGITHYKGVRQ